MKDFKAIIFDMDGLLVDSEIVWHEAENALIQSRGYAYTTDVRESIVGLRIDEFMAKLRDHYNLPETLQVLVDELNHRMLELIPKRVKPRPGAQAIIDYVVANQIPRAIASNSSLEIINKTLEAMGWDDVFTIRCTADDEPQGKPAPYVYQTASRRLGMEAHECLALEDSVNGSRAVVAAGMTCYAVPDTSHSTADKFADITPYVFDSLYDVLAVLKG